jgi:hypothetical protein
LAVDLELDEREVLDPCERVPIRPDAVDRDGDVVVPQPPGNVFDEVQVANDLRRVELDHQPLERRMFRHPPAQIIGRLEIPKEGDRQIYRDLDMRRTSFFGRNAQNAPSEGSHLKLTGVRRIQAGPVLEHATGSGHEEGISAFVVPIRGKSPRQS